MPNDSIQRFPISTADTEHLSYYPHTQEHILAALTLLLGPETTYALRLRAARRLARQGPSILPVILATLHAHPEITSPSWPHWPPQYEQCSRLLLHLSQRAGFSLESLLHHPAISAPVGPVLWTSIIEAADLQPSATYEPLLCQGLTAPWQTTRYAAAMALANLTHQASLSATTLELLHASQHTQETLSLRIAASYALLRSNDSRGLAALMQLLVADTADASIEARKAAIFILASEPPPHLCPAQRSRLIQLLLAALQDTHSEIALHAAHALTHVALPSTLPMLRALLSSSRPQVQIATLIALEELASSKTMRLAMHQYNLPALVAPLLRSDTTEIHRQAACTLASLGGAFATAVLGTTLLDKEHPAHLAAIEGLRYLHGALHAPLRSRIISWLLCALHQPDEHVQVTALDSLAHLVSQAHTNGYKKYYFEISSAILQDTSITYLLASPHAWVRQRTVELLGMLAQRPESFHDQFLHLLHSDNDSGVRACVAYVLGTLQANWAIPSLLHALLDPDEYVAETALNALVSIASPDHAIVGYILKELAQEEHKESSPHRLARAARRLLKTWRRTDSKRRQSLALLL